MNDKLNYLKSEYLNQIRQWNHHSDTDVYRERENKSEYFIITEIKTTPKGEDATIRYLKDSCIQIRHLPYILKYSELV